MASPITNAFAATVSATCGQNSLASSTSGVGRQSGEFSTAGATHISIMEKAKCGTSPTSNAPWWVYAIGNNGAGSPVRTDSAGSTDAAWTALNARLILTLTTKSSAATGDTLTGDVTALPVGWATMAIGVVNGTGVTSDATAGNFDLSYSLFNLQV